MAWQELRALDDRFGMVLAGHDLIETALQASNESLANARSSSPAITPERSDPVASAWFGRRC
jgi:hypothetical protein